MNELAPRPSQPCQQITYGPVSLWHMLELRAADFIEAIKLLSWLKERFTDEPMPDPPDSKLKASKTFLTGEEGSDILLSFSEIFKHQYSTLRHYCEKLNAGQTVLFIDEILKEFDTKDPTIGWSLQRVDDLFGSLRREMTNVKFYVLEREYANFYEEPNEKFLGFLIENDFSQSRFDFSEAAKCLAVGRSNASVMHTMLAIEPALEKVASRLKVTVVQPATWGEIISKCRDEMKILDIGKDRKWVSHEARRLFNDTASHFRCIQLAVRDPKFHGSLNFSQADAKKQFEDAKSFMVSVAALPLVASQRSS